MGVHPGLRKHDEAKGARGGLRGQARHTTAWRRPGPGHCAGERCPTCTVGSIYEGKLGGDKNVKDLGNDSSTVISRSSRFA